MQFLSPVWLAWMVFTVGIYWLAPLSFRFLTLIAISGAFLAIHDPLSLVILLSLTLWTHAMTRREVVDGRLCLATCFVIVAVLGWYKVQIIQDLDIQNLSAAAIPLGLSYYSFRLLHYVIERYKGTVQPADLPEFLAYLFFIPTLVVGPIHRYPQFHKDYHRARLDLDPSRGAVAPRRRAGAGAARPSSLRPCRGGCSLPGRGR
jgi:alginate O-acetyltransferase complex protein AlgI